MSRLSQHLAPLAAAVRALVGTLAVGLVVAALVWPAHTETVADLATGAPRRLEMPSVGATVKVVPIRLDGTTLSPPEDYTEVGWWRRSAVPGSTTGQTVITGHTVHTGGGSMNGLPDLKVDQEVDLVTDAGTIQYEIDSVQIVPKSQLPARAKSLFGQGHGEGRLVLITCDDWDGHDYLSNIVVIAHPFAAAKKATHQG